MLFAYHVFDVYTAIEGEESWPQWWLAWLKLCIGA